ncbi:DEAD/DEAH box helicase [Mongoliimonas terrestris]|uniref:DEAD/DEAH box helicase n=1 Tax=Mongoliimonas terrestris TaxID=1709001 RepID=UPI00094978B3|nr:DEAD/DEAH box helicase [Mongoliimonas terrestris]
MSFSELGLSDKVLAAVEAAGYTTPTPIQAEAIPHAVSGRDVIGIAQTGTGKTASFVLPMMTLLEKGRARARMPRTLILEPTRELAAQVEENFVKYGVNQKLTVALLIGGVSFDEQDRKLDRGVDVLIATPGRLLDHFERGKLLLNGVEILVIDEADRMLDMGFIPDIERILKLITKKHQTLFFSATMPPEIQRLTESFLTNPVRIEVAKPATTAKTVAQRLIASGYEAHEKRQVLRDLIADAKDLKNAIVFCNRKKDVAVLFRSLEKHGFNVGALHGDMDQRARMATLDAFKKGTLTLLVASDVAARGLDIPDVSHVYNFDVPIHAEDYVHRIGRTGRAGRSGTAITLVTPDDIKYLSAIEKLTGDDVEWIGEKVQADPDSRRRRRAASASPSRGDRSERGDRPERSNRSDRPDRSDDARPSARVSRSRPDRPRAAEDGAERAPRAAAEDRPERAPRVRAERTERPEAPVEREAAPVEARAPREPRRDAAPRPADPRPPRREERPAPPRGGDRNGRPRRDHDDGPTVIGLGDHVPAFLLRPVRTVKQAS